MNFGRLAHHHTHTKIHQYIYPSKQFSNPVNKAGTLNKVRAQSGYFALLATQKTYLPAVKTSDFPSSVPSLEWNTWVEARATDLRAGVLDALPGASCPQPWLTSGTESRQQPTTNHLQSTQKVLGLKEAGSCGTRRGLELAATAGSLLFTKAESREHSED